MLSPYKYRFCPELDLQKFLTLVGGGLGEGGEGGLLNGFLLTFKSIRWLDFKGVSRIFSRRSGFKKKILGLFFRSTKLIFRALPKHYKIPVLAKNSVPQAKFEKKQAKKGVSRHFFENVDRKKEFFRRTLPPHLSLYWRQKRL